MTEAEGKHEALDEKRGVARGGVRRAQVSFVTVCDVITGSSVGGWADTTCHSGRGGIR